MKNDLSIEIEKYLQISQNRTFRETAYDLTYKWSSLLETMFLTMIPETHFIKTSLVPWFVGVHHIGLHNSFEQTESFTKPFTLNVKIYFILISYSNY